MIGVAVDQEKGSCLEILEERAEVVVGNYQDQGQVQWETKLDVSDAENMIILPKECPNMALTEKRPIRPNATIIGYIRTVQYV